MFNSAVFAHRGASNSRFENTLSAFQQAVKEEADGIELDVQLSSDGIPFIVHDESLQRVAGINRFVSSLTSDELRHVRVGKPFWRVFCGHPIPTLQQAVDFCMEHQLLLNVELKESVVVQREALPLVLHLISPHSKKHISSFHYELLEEVKALQPDIETAYLLRKNSTAWEDLYQYEFADGFHFHKRLWKSPFKEALIASGKKLRMYGVTGKEPFLKQHPSEICGWITDFPSRFT